MALERGTLSRRQHRNGKTVTGDVKKFAVTCVTALAVLAGAISLVGCGSSSATHSTSAASGTPASSTASGSTSAGASAGEDSQVAAEVPSAVKKAGTLTSINYNNSPPATFLQGSQLVGWQVDLAKAVSATMGLKFTPTVSGTFAIFIPGLQNGRFETSFSPLIVTAAREKQIDMVSVFRVGTGFVTKTGSSVKITTLEDVCGVKVAALIGSAFVASVSSVDAKCRAAGKQPPKIYTYPDNSSAQLSLQSGRTDAFADTADELGYLAEKAPTQFTLQPYQFSPVDESIGVSPRSGLAKPIAAAMDHLIKTGAYASIMHKWGVNTGLIGQAQVNPASS